MPPPTNAYELELSGLSTEEIDEIRRSIRKRELKMLGMAEDDLELLDARLAGGDADYTPMQRALLEASRKRVRQQAEALEARQQKAQERRWQVFSGELEPTPRAGAEPYWADDEYLQRASAYVAPPPAIHTVSAYCRWVHLLYSRRIGSRSAMDYGKFVERSVAKLARFRVDSDWVELYHDPLDVKPTGQRISALTLNGAPLWGAPDYVLRHKRTGEVVIIERKASECVIPLDGWPDLRAQLWCYAQIDQWRDAPVIRLVAEVWRYDANGLTLRSSEGGVLRWMKGDPAFDAPNAQLFALYKARVEGRRTETGVA